MGVHSTHWLSERRWVWQRECNIVSGVVKNLEFTTNIMMTLILAVSPNVKEKQEESTKVKSRSDLIVLNKMNLIDTDNVKLSRLLIAGRLE